MANLLYVITDETIVASPDGTMSYEQAIQKIKAVKQTGAKEALFTPALTRLDKLAISKGFKDIDDAIMWANNDDRNNVVRREIAIKLRGMATALWNKINNVEVEGDSTPSIEEVVLDEDLDIELSTSTAENSISSSNAKGFAEIFKERY